MKPLETTPEEVLRKAIQSEVETREYYLKLSERAGTPEVKTRLIELAEGEMLHRAKLERMYHEQIGHPPPDPEPPAKIEIPWDVRNLTMSQALKLALEHERDAESNFRFLAERVPDTDLGGLFLELAEIEWKHKSDLQAEYEATFTDPDQFFRDM